MAIAFYRCSRSTDPQVGRRGPIVIRDMYPYHIPSSNSRMTDSDELTQPRC